MADEIAAFANSRGGTLLCGVNDDGTLHGMSREQTVELDRLFVEISTNAIKPPIRIITSHWLLGDQRVLVVEIPEGDSQHDSSSGSYLPVGGTKQRMTSDERLRLAQRRGQARFRSSDQCVVPETGFGTLEETLWKPLLSKEGAFDPESALQKLGMLDKDDSHIVRATVAGVLVCTHRPENWIRNACISAACYRGLDRDSQQIDAQEITGPIQKQVDVAVTFAIRNMHVTARKEPERIDIPQYSDRALFEAIVNAVAHRDYSIIGSKIRLAMFEDRIEIKSPGGLPDNLTTESIVSRQSDRNHALTSVLRDMPVKGIHGSNERLYFMERRGDGVPIIFRETQKLCGRLPEYRLVDGSELCLTIPAAPQDPSPVRATVIVRAGERSVRDADVLILFPNATWKSAKTDSAGHASVGLHTASLPMTVFVAAPGLAAHLEQDWMPGSGPLEVKLKAVDAGGSLIFSTRSGGSLPGLSGVLRPVLDSLNRTYLYTHNIAVNKGMPQPVSFLPGESLQLTDSNGRELWIRIIDMAGEASLIEYSVDR